MVKADALQTVTICGLDEVPESIMENGSVAVDNLDPDKKNVYGDLCLVKYTWFLLENYYFMHDELCNAAGQALLRHILGHDGQEELISLLKRLQNLIKHSLEDKKNYFKS